MVWNNTNSENCIIQNNDIPQKCEWNNEFCLLNWKPIDAYVEQNDFSFNSKISIVDTRNFVVTLFISSGNFMLKHPHYSPDVECNKIPRKNNLFGTKVQLNFPQKHFRSNKISKTWLLVILLTLKIISSSSFKYPIKIN